VECVKGKEECAAPEGRFVSILSSSTLGVSYALQAWTASTSIFSSDSDAETAGKKVRTNTSLHKEWIVQVCCLLALIVLAVAVVRGNGKRLCIIIILVNVLHLRVVDFEV
jgi:hypothetical protein